MIRVSDAHADPVFEPSDRRCGGSGLESEQWAEGALNRVMDSGLPMVMDADALNMLAERPSELPNAILTPPKRRLECWARRVVGLDRLEVLQTQDRYQRRSRAERCCDLSPRQQTCVDQSDRRASHGEGRYG